ncbi:SDR family oxidoreductase [Phenylobacterium sp.]|uniref:SDR family oxidoreductase n=1 Tax=Phenylobacterium sp. TaxID=1871053 RepID=UPI0027159223|nr:SDR family oxidoreductase [Phenylobacterium sp.]MDO8377563.1 SDR family oxidoreductase [Phenylobacterium sp.]
MAELTQDDLMFRPGLMKGERILITGGGTGLGKVMAEACLILGAEVYICGRRGGVVEAAAKDLMAAHGGKVVGIACDIRVPEAITDMMDQIWADGGALTGLVNNAAGNFISRTQDLSPRGFDAIANIVFRGSFFVTLDAGKRWIAEGKKASVVSILTTWIWNGGPFTVPSAMSKAGLATMSQSLAVEWGPYGIRFNNIAPGPFPTEGMSARLNPGEQRDDGEASRTGNPMGRVGEMRELANLAVYLLHPLSAYVNGQTIAIDGAAWQASGGNFSGLRAWTDEQWTAAREAIQATNAKDRAARTV